MNLNLITGPLSQAVGGYLQGDQQRQARDQQTALLNYQLKRQQEQDQFKNTLLLRQQQQEEQQNALKDRLQGFIPSAAPKAEMPANIIQGEGTTPDSMLSRDESLAKMEAPVDPNAPKSIVPLPNVDTRQVLAAKLDQGRRASGVPGYDYNPDDTPAASLERGRDLRATNAQNAQMDRLESQQASQDARAKAAQEAADQRQLERDTRLYGRQVALENLRAKHEIDLANVRGEQARETKAVGGGAAGVRTSSPQEMAQIGIAINQALAAKKTMDAFEDDLINRRVSIGPLDMEAANKVLRGGFGSGVTDAALSSSFGNARLRDYVMGAKAIANADRLVAKRGGSQQMVNAEQLLSSVGPNAKPASIRQARAMREATLAGLAKSAQALGWSDMNGAAVGDPHAALKAQLKAQGYSDQQITDYFTAHPDG